MSARPGNRVTGRFILAMSVITTSTCMAVGACSTNPAIYRAKGTVVSVEPTTGREVKVCLERAIKAAGSTYGKPPADGRICLDGIADSPALPVVGECVILQVQGEGSALRIEPGTACV